MKNAKNIVGKKICEYLRYLQSWKYGDLNQDEHEILQRKWFPDDYRNLGNFSNFGHIFKFFLGVDVIIRNTATAKNDNSLREKGKE